MVLPRPNRPEPAPAKSGAVARRRHIVMVLLLATVLTGVLVFLGPTLGLTRLSPALILVPVMPLVAYLGLLALTASSRHPQPASAVATGTRRRVPSPEGAKAAPGGVADRQTATATEVVSRTSIDSGEPATVHPTESSPAAVAPPEPAAPPQQSPVSTVEEPAESSTWTPIPVPLPTYVNAFRAQSSVRTIDLSTNGPWSVVEQVEDTTTSQTVTDERQAG